MPAAAPADEPRLRHPLIALIRRPSLPTTLPSPIYLPHSSFPSDRYSVEPRAARLRRLELRSPTVGAPSSRHPLSSCRLSSSIASSQPPSCPRSSRVRAVAPSGGPPPVHPEPPPVRRSPWLSPIECLLYLVPPSSSSSSSAAPTVPSHRPLLLRDHTAPAIVYPRRSELSPLRHSPAVLSGCRCCGSPTPAVPSSLLLLRSPRARPVLTWQRAASCLWTSMSKV